MSPPRRGFYLRRPSRDALLDEARTSVRLEEGRQFSPELQQQVRRFGQEFDLREGATATVNLRLTLDL